MTVEDKPTVEYRHDGPFPQAILTPARYAIRLAIRPYRSLFVVWRVMGRYARRWAKRNGYQIGAVQLDRVISWGESQILSPGWHQPLDTPEGQRRNYVYVSWRAVCAVAGRTIPPDWIDKGRPIYVPIMQPLRVGEWGP